MRSFLCGCAIAAWLAAPACAATAASDDGAAIAAKFGARAEVEDISLSPDGTHVVYISPGPGASTVAMVASTAGGEAKAVSGTVGSTMRLTSCGWSANDRIVCQEYGVTSYAAQKLGFARLVSFNADGSHVLSLARGGSRGSERISQSDGDVLDWLKGDDGTVLMERDYVPQDTRDTNIQTIARNGLGVDRVDTRTGRSRTIERPSEFASSYITDGQGNVRIMETPERNDKGTLSGTVRYSFRAVGARQWQALGRKEANGSGLRPIAVDGTANVAYALRQLDGRDALYRVALDGTGKADLVYADAKVDVAGVVTLGRSGRVIGASYVTDRQQVEYFDPQYKALRANLAKALGNLSIVAFISASADESKLIVFAASDTDAGHYYMLDRATKHMAELLVERPEMAGLTLATVRSVSYPAADGKIVPAYLTLPPGSSGKHIPAIVMPHGGPASRDEWGFDWLVQFYAQRGFAVLQPEFRGSSGFGDDWFVNNGFKSWNLAIGDVNDAGRWLVQQGIADPDKLAIVGWSYGGYAALQSNVVDPGLFKAVVAIAPVTDFGMIKNNAVNYTSSRIVADMVGDGPQIEAGSPLRHVDRFKAPVIMFQGDQDINVDIAEAQAMDGALRRAGKISSLVVYKGRDHQLDDGAVRTDMLAKSDAFLRSSLNIAP